MHVTHEPRGSGCKEANYVSSQRELAPPGGPERDRSPVAAATTTHGHLQNVARPSISERAHPGRSGSEDRGCGKIFPSRSDCGRAAAWKAALRKNSHRRRTFPIGARPVPGRSSHDSAKPLEYLEDAHHRRARCAPGLSRAPLGLRLRRAGRFLSARSEGSAQGVLVLHLSFTRRSCPQT